MKQLLTVDQFYSSGIRWYYVSYLNYLDKN